MRQIYAAFSIFLLSSLLICYHADAQKKLVIIGSSTAACFGINGDSCFVGRLRHHYGAAAQFNNLAVSGNSVYRGMPSAYTPPAGRGAPDTAHNITAALKANPDAVLVNYPSNGYDLFSVAEVMLCLRVINETARNAGVRCYITTTQPRSEPASYRTSETKRKMAEIKDSILKEFGLFAINFWDDIVNPADSSIITTLGQGDGTHLNEKGHAILFQKLRQKDIFAVSSPLPVKFIDFTANVSKDATVLEWTTALERNIQHYQILRSEDGIQFKTIQTIQANNSLQQVRYLFRDNNPLQSSYYQIAAVGLDNHRDFSSVVKVLLNQKPFSIQKLFFRNSLLYASIESGERQIVNLKVLNSSGQLLAKLTAPVNAGINTLAINVSLPGKAVYYLHLSSKGFALQVKPFITE